MQRITQGQPLKSISASTWNAMADAAQHYQERKRLGDPAGENLSKLTSDFVDVRNDTGADRRGGDVVEIGDKIIDELTVDHLWFEGLEPDETRTYGIVRKSLESGKIGRCQVSGVAKAYVNVTDEDHNFAIVEEGSYVLKSSRQGAVRIVSKPAGTGELECAVLLGVPHEVFMGTAELAADMCEETNPTLQNFVGWKAGSSVIMPDPSPTSAVNLFQHMGMAGDIVLIIYSTDPEIEDWVVVEVSKHVEAIPVRHAFESGCWVYYTKRFAMEKCSDDEERQEYICGGSC